MNIAWGILGAGNIARAFAKGLKASRTGRLVAVGSRDLAKAQAFGAAHGAERSYGSYDDLLADRAVDAVYIATPHPLHAEWAIRALEAGKNVLCEKPLGLNHAQAMVMFEAAERSGRLLMEAYMYRCHPQIQKLVELIREKAVGDVRLIEARFGFNAAFNPHSRLFNHALGGGGILDVGGYPISLARLVAGAATGRDFAEPLELKGVGFLGLTGVDEVASAVLKFPGNIFAEVATSIALARENIVRIHGTLGEITLPEPWIPARDGGEVRIFVKRKGEAAREELFKAAPLYALEADTFAASVEQGVIAAPAMTPADSLGNLKALDLWRESIGLVYESEKTPAPVSSRAPKASPKASMAYAKMPGVDKRLSRLIMGVDNQKTAPHAFAIFDDFIERGGNAFDTAWIYANGACERVLGRWMAARGLRDELFLIGKGAHTPFCDPLSITRQLQESLDRMQTRYVDLYMLHRDNPAVPVADFVEVLNGHLREGRVKALGASNWTLERVDQFNAYAKSKGLQGFSAVSNQMSLARMVDPVWAGCLSASDPISRAWFEKTKTALLPWSSQARGFFLPGRARPNNHSDAELSRCWYSEDNFKRLERVNAFAEKKKTLPINVALAYILCQPFPTFPLIGPRLISETRTSLPALDIVLSPGEMRWLNLETDTLQS